MRCLENGLRCDPIFYPAIDIKRNLRRSHRFTNIDRFDQIIGLLGRRFGSLRVNADLKRGQKLPSLTVDVALSTRVGKRVGDD